MTIDATPIVVCDSEGRITRVPLVDLCPCCAEQPIDPDGDDRLCAKCRVDFEKHQRGWEKREKGQVEAQADAIR